MARVCHTNNCPVGVASQREELRARFPGTPDDVVNYFAIVAEEVRAGLRAVKNGRLVNLAVFDHRFTGKPQRRPVASLMWKDWRGEEQGSKGDAVHGAPICGENPGKRVGRSGPGASARQGRIAGCGGRHRWPK